jgi:hypothetical protein
MSIRGKLWSLVAGLLLLTAAMTGMLGYQLFKSNQHLSSIYSNQVVPMQDIKLISDGYGIKLVEITNKVYNQQILADSGKEQLTEVKKNAEAAWQAYLPTVLTPEEKELADRVGVLLDAITPRIDDVLRLFERQDHDSLGSFIEYRLFPSVSPLAAALQQLSAMQEEQAQSAYNEAQSSLRQAVIAAGVTAATKEVVDNTSGLLSGGNVITILLILVILGGAAWVMRERWMKARDWDI